MFIHIWIGKIIFRQYRLHRNHFETMGNNPHPPIHDTSTAWKPQDFKRHAISIFLRGKKKAAEKTKPQTSFRLHFFLVIFPFQAQPIRWHLFAICHYLKFYSCIPLALLMVCHYSHVCTCLAWVGERKKTTKKKKERELPSSVGLAQLRQQQCWLQHPVGHGLLSNSISLRGTAGRAESDRVKTSIAGLADFTPKPTVLEVASHAF